MLRTLWSDYIAPMLRRPARYQLAALCYRRKGNGIEVLLVTSRETRRWIIPKGWPKSGYDSGGVALEEAWEEAGIKPRGRKPRRVGRYSYRKVLEGGVPVPTEVDVYAIEVEKLYDTYPEAGQRERRWVPPADAAEMVEEPDLQELLRKVGASLSEPVSA